MLTCEGPVSHNLLLVVHMCWTCGMRGVLVEECPCVSYQLRDWQVVCNLSAGAGRTLLGQVFYGSSLLCRKEV